MDTLLNCVLHVESVDSRSSRHRQGERRRVNMADGCGLCSGIPAEAERVWHGEEDGSSSVVFASPGLAHAVDAANGLKL